VTPLLDVRELHVDAILLEVLRNELVAVTEEMAISIEKTGRSPMLRTGDFSTALADRRGNVLGLQSPAFFISAFTTVLESVLKKWGADFAEGDVVVCNDPYLGGSHRPDVFVLMPVFHETLLAGFTLAYSHHTDIGGRFPGGMSSQALSSYEEGIDLPAVKLFERNIRNEAVADLLVANIRAGEEFLADIDAKVSGCWRGARAFELVLEKYGLPSVESCYDHVLDFQERATRDAIAAIADGDYTGEITLFDDGLGTDGVALPLVVKLSFRGDELLVDLTGTAQQVASGINMPLANTFAQIYDTLHALLGGGIPFNTGFTRPLTITVPPGTLLNPIHPAAVGGRAPVLYLLTETLYRAMANVVPERVPAAGSGVDAVLFSGTRRSGSPYATMDLIPGSWGARPDRDGVDGAANNYFSAISAERIESEIPVVIEELSLTPDSGGPGEFRGGLSVVKQYRFLEDASVVIRTNRHAGGSFGSNGGRQGSPAKNTHFGHDGASAVLPSQSHVHVVVQAGDRIRHETGGAGGHGTPSARGSAALLCDVGTGKVSAEGAQRDYGVAVDAALSSAEVRRNSIDDASLSQLSNDREGLA
jgi:N-methylhydantoinase B